MNTSSNVKLNDHITRSLTAQINLINEQFTLDDSNQRPIAEHAFVEYFLPMFAGDEQPRHAVTPHMWMNLVHGPFNEAKVVDGQGQVLFTVPALYSQTAMKPLDGTGQAGRLPTVTDMIQAARMYAVRGSNVMQHFIHEELGKRAFMFNQKNMDAETIARWNVIFARYNRPLLPTLTSATNATTADTNVDIGRDSSEFDPL